LNSRVLVIMLTITGVILGLWATFLITSQEPNASADEGFSLRRTIRGAAIAGALGAMLSQTAQLGGGMGAMFGPVATPAPAALILILVGAILQLALVVQMFGEFVYYRRFARRIPDRKLEQNTSTVMWGIVISYGVMFVGGVIAAILGIGAVLTAASTGGTSSTAPAVAAGGVVLVGFTVCFAGIGGFVFGIWYIVLLFQYRQAFLAALGTHAGNSQP